MAFVAGNLSLLLSPIDNSQAGRVWYYYSPTDSDATVYGAGYMSTALTYGMAVGDLVLVYDVTNTVIKSHQCLSFTGNAANLSSGTTIGTAS